jgi:hypothetical protein
MRAFAFAASAAALIAAPAWAQNTPPNPRVYGMIETVSAKEFTVADQNGKIYTIALDAHSRVVADSKLTVEGIKPGDHFAADLVKDGSGWRAVIGHTQSEDFANNVLWFRPVTGKPGERRILGIVESVTPEENGARVKVRYDMGELEFKVPSNATLFHVSFDGSVLLKPNVAVNAVYKKAPDGTMTGRFVTVEKNGQKPVLD